MTITVHHADCLDAMREMADASVDAVVTDPPYHLTNNTGARSPLPGQYTPIGKPKQPKGGFMGKAWDGGDIAFRAETWAEVARVMKPGAHLVAFGGSKTWHRLACAIEDAGFEIRDTLMFMYGCGFPKSVNISKAIDKAAGAEREVVGPSNRHAGRTKANGSIPDLARYGAAGDCVTAPTTDAARQWDGWGTALKPAFEPILLARRPLAEPTVAANVLVHGTGALNVDSCRVAYTSEHDQASAIPQGRATAKVGAFAGSIQNENIRTDFAADNTKGRWPPNLLHDGSPEVLAAFERFGEKASGGAVLGGNDYRPAGYEHGIGGRRVPYAQRDDTGTAARFFPALGYSDDDLRFHYSSKAGQDDRCGSRHPTVKPVALMRWLCRLVVPPSGIVLDPFAGTGVTGEAAHLEGFSAVLIEREAEYVADINRRIDLVTRQGTFFEMLA